GLVVVTAPGTGTGDADTPRSPRAPRTPRGARDASRASPPQRQGSGRVLPRAAPHATPLGHTLRTRWPNRRHLPGGPVQLRGPFRRRDLDLPRTTPAPRSLGGRRELDTAHRRRRRDGGGRTSTHHRVRTPAGHPR